jgi:PleD family two-component response regulator
MRLMTGRSWLERAAEMNPFARPMSAAAQRILVVDDDPEIRKLLARYIESQGFRVLLAANCRELREQLATHQIDLIVLDVMLPDGWASTLPRPPSTTFRRADHPAYRAQGGCRPHHRTRDRR